MERTPPSGDSLTGALEGRRVEVFRAVGGTWRGTVAWHDCAGIMLVDPVPGRYGVLFIPWARVQWIEVLDLGSAA